MIDARQHVGTPQGTQKNPNAGVIGVAVHHSVSGDYLTPSSSEAEELAHIKAIDKYHRDQGWLGFGYHMAAFPSGRLYLCGDLDGQRAHVAGRNHVLRGVVAIGTFTTRLPGQPQLRAIAEGIREIRAFIGRELPARGHNEWALPGQGTGCAGLLNGFDWTPYLGEEEEMYTPHVAIAEWFEKRALPPTPDGQFWTMQAHTDFGLPETARGKDLQLAVYMDSGVLRLFHGSTAAEAGAAGERGVNYVQLRGKVDPAGTLNFRAEGPVNIARVVCLGYYG